MDLADVNFAKMVIDKMVIDKIKAVGGLLDGQLDLYLEDGATTASVAAAKATKLLE
jgi:branched-chain amino acid transport system substrate-binding protein